jgi:hypothetical protein
VGVRRTMRLQKLFRRNAIFAVAALSVGALPSASCSQALVASGGPGRMLHSASIPAAELIAARASIPDGYRVEVLLHDSVLLRQYPGAAAASTTFLVHCGSRSYGFYERRFYAPDGRVLHRQSLDSEAVVSNGPAWPMLAEICSDPMGTGSTHAPDFVGIGGFLALVGSTSVSRNQSPPPEVIQNP